MIDLDGCVAIVTGAGGGLGKCYALEFGRRGARVVVREPDGNLQCVLWPTSGQYEAQAFRGVVPDNVVAIVHTHPPRMDPRPSPGDIKAAQRLGLAIYVLTRHGIYAADPSGAVVPVIERPDWITAAMRGPRCACKPTEHPR